MAETLGELILKFGADTGNFISQMGKMSSQTKSSLQTVKNEAKNVSLALGAISAIGVAAIVKTTQAAMEFEKDMRNVNTMTRLSEEGFKSLSNQVIKLSSVVPESADSLAKGLYTVVSAGVPAEEQMKFLEIAAKAAAAGLSDTRTAALGVTGVIKAYGMEFTEAERVSDLFFKTVELGQTTFGEMASSVGLVTPLANTLGLSLEELSAVFATLTGVTGSTAEVATQLRGILTAVAKGSKQSTEMADSLGLTFDVAGIKAMGFSKWLEEVRVKTGGNVETMSKLFGRVEALNGILALTGTQMDTYTDKLGQMKDSAGAMTDAFGEQMKSFSAQWQLFKNDLTKASMALGMDFMPVLRDLMSHVKGLVDAFNNLSPEMKEMIAKTILIGTAVTGVGAVVAGMVSIFAGAILKVGALTTAFGGASAGATGFGATLSKLIVAGGPLVLVIAALTTLGIVANNALKKWEESSIATQAAVKGVSNAQIEAKNFTQQYGDVLDLTTKKVKELGLSEKELANQKERLKLLIQDLIQAEGINEQKKRELIASYQDQILMINALMADLGAEIELEKESINTSQKKIDITNILSGALAGASAGRVNLKKLETNIEKRLEEEVTAKVLEETKKQMAINEMRVEDVRQTIEAVKKGLGLSETLGASFAGPLTEGYTTTTTTGGMTREQLVARKAELERERFMAGGSTIAIGMIEAEIDKIIEMLHQLMVAEKAAATTQINIDGRMLNTGGKIENALNNFVDAVDSNVGFAYGV